MSEREFMQYNVQVHTRSRNIVDDMFVWQSEFPTKDGVYWVVVDGGVDIVSVSVPTKSFNYYNICNASGGHTDDESHYEVEEVSYWLGPLPEPEIIK